jgi:hypothetical protein
VSSEDPTEITEKLLCDEVHGETADASVMSQLGSAQRNHETT